MPSRYRGLHFIEGKPLGRPSSHMDQFPTRHLRRSLLPPRRVDSHLAALRRIYQEISSQHWDRTADKLTGHLFLGNVFCVSLFCYTLKPKESKAKNSFTLLICTTLSNISHTRDCIDTFPNTEKRAKTREYFFRTRRFFEMW